MSEGNRQAAPPNTGAPPLPTQITLLAAATLAPMAGATIAPALPFIHAHFAAEPDADFLVRLLLTTPGLTIGIVAPFAGFFLDRYSKRRILLAAVMAYIVAGSAGLFLNDLIQLLLSRACLGVALAFITCSVTALSADLFETSARATFFGRNNSANSVTGLAYVLCAGMLADVSWRGAFLIYLTPLALLFFLWRHVPRYSAAATQANRGAIAAPGHTPWLQMAMMCLLAVMCSACFYIVLTQSPFLITDVHGGSATVSGIAIGLFTIAALPLSFTYGRVRKQLSPWAVFAIAYASTGAGFVLQSHAGTVIELIVAITVTGTGFGFLVPNITTTLLNITPTRLRGRASGVLVACFFVGQFLSPLMNQPLVRLYGLNRSLLLTGASLLLLAAIMLGVSRNPPAAATLHG